MSDKPMKKKYIQNTHPGEFLKELIKDLKLTQYKVAKAIGKQQTLIGEITRTERNISPEVGMLLDAFFGFSEGYFSRLQNHYDMMETKRKIATRLSKIIPYQHDARV